MNRPLARACQASWDNRPVVGPSARQVPSASKLVPASTTSVLIRVSTLALRMRIVPCETTIPFAAVHPSTVAILSSIVFQSVSTPRPVSPIFCFVPSHLRECANERIAKANNAKLCLIEIWPLSRIFTILPGCAFEFVEKLDGPSPVDPCQPSPCGANSQCRPTSDNTKASCSCLPGFLGSGNQDCRPECRLNSDCPNDRGCVQNKCRDPCPGACGQNARCVSAAHQALCSCPDGFQGDPYLACLPAKSKTLTF